jgi:hypothetical protein
LVRTFTVGAAAETLGGAGPLVVRSEALRTRSQGPRIYSRATACCGAEIVERPSRRDGRSLVCSACGRQVREWAITRDGRVIGSATDAVPKVGRAA